MQRGIGNGIDEDGGTWAHSIFKVIDDLIEHDLSSGNGAFAIGVGANCATSIFDVIGTVQQIKDMELPEFRKNMPATTRNIGKILDILERNGARNIRRWVRDVTLIQDLVSDYMAALFYTKLRDDGEFVRKFVYEFLPRSCREFLPQDSRVSFVENWTVRGISFFKSASREDIYEVVEKAKCYFLRQVKTHSIFSVQETSRIIRGCVNEKELSTERKQELLERVEPFIYGQTPLFQSLEKATNLFEEVTSDEKLLFVLSDGHPSDGSNEDSRKISQITSKLSKAGVTIVSCFVTKSTDIHPKRLFDEVQSDWETGAKFLFSLSSVVPTQHLPRAILAKRGWKIDVSKNETKLFIQVNNPDNLR
jgi:hypothetical protein